MAASRHVPRGENAEARRFTGLPAGPRTQHRCTRRLSDALLGFPDTPVRYPRTVGLQRGGECVFPDLERLVELLVGDDERHEDANAVPVHP